MFRYKELINQIIWAAFRHHEKLNFKRYIDKVLTKASKGIAVIKSLRNSLPRKSLITIYKAIIRPHLDYENILYDQPNNATFYQKI